MAAKKKEQTFEERLGELEELVKKMEAGGLPLHETLSCYERGMVLSKTLNEEIEKATQRLSELKDGQIVPLEDL